MQALAILGWKGAGTKEIAISQVFSNLSISAFDQIGYFTAHVN